MTLADKWVEDTFEIISDGIDTQKIVKDTIDGELDLKEEKSIDDLDDFNPADMIYDSGDIQIYKNEDAMIMIKVLSMSPKKFVALYVETTKLTNKEALEELDDAIEAPVESLEGGELNGRVTE